MKTNRLKVIIFIIIPIIFLLFFYLTSVYEQPFPVKKAAGKLEVLSSDENYYFDEIHNIRFPGRNMDSTTYYFLPSYIHNDEIVQTSDTIKVYLEDGSLLQRARFGELQNVNVDYGNGDLIPWKMCFIKSEHISSIFINLDTPTGINDLNRDSYSTASIDIYNTEGFLDYSDDQVMIKGRGNSTWLEWAKKPLEIKLLHNESLCGLMPSSKWVLLANYYDGTLMTNKIAFDLAKSIGLNFTTDSYWVDVFSNNEYMGLYLLCKEPKIDKYNVDIDNIEKTNDLCFETAEHYASRDFCAFKYLAAPQITDSGYLIKKESAEPFEKKPCRFISSGKSFAIQSPDNASVEQAEYIRNYIVDVDASINKNDDDRTCMIDKDSFVRRFLVEEFMFNQDAFARSYYFYKKAGNNILYAGPCWDYDNAVGFQEEVSDVFLDYDNSLLEDNISTERFTPDEILYWDSVLYKNDEDYHEHMREVFAEERSEFEAVIFEKIPEYENIIYASAVMDNLIWPETQKKYDSFDDNIRYLRFFLYHRLIHMSEMLEDSNPLPSFSVNTDTSHTVTFIIPGQSDIKMQCIDGSQLSSEALPKYDRDKYYWKKDNRYNIFYSFFCPIYEDTVFELKEL